MALEESDLVGTTIGAYRIVSRLGVGGMGAVYRAEQAPLGRPVALKVIHDHLAADAAVAARFLREARIACSLRNPNTVTVYDFGQSSDGRLYMAMELLEGETLSAHIDRVGAVAPADAVEIGIQICRSLAEAHAKAIVHRDLKSDNVFLGTADDGAMLVTVLDYGIAHAGPGFAASGPAAGAEPLTQQGMVVGTPAYMSPEQARGEAVDGRCDLYSLGVILYEMLTGEPPFRGETPIATLGKLLTELPAPMASVGVRKAPPPELEALVRALLQKDPELRPATALSVQSRLRTSLRAPPAGAAPAAPPTTRPVSSVELDGPWGLPSELRPAAGPSSDSATVEVRAATPPAAAPPAATRAAATPPAAARPSRAPAVAIDPDASPFEHEASPVKLEVDRRIPVEVDMPLAMRRRSSMPPRPRPSRMPPPAESRGIGTWSVGLLVIAVVAAGAWWWWQQQAEELAQSPDPAGDGGASAPAPPPSPSPVEPAPSTAALARQEEALRAEGFEPAALPSGGWSGSYDLDGGTLRLFEAGGRVTGTFESALRSGRIEGTLATDGRLEFDWQSTDTGAVRAAQVRSGRGVLQSWTHRRDRRLSGTWGFGTESDGALWLAVPRVAGRAPRAPGRPRGR